ncbi:long-chain-fatty-acid--CoA ligase [Maritimibacter dapengensis]|uniref:Long-chain-fatty-acid--CoA ligase n=1 Tax=Maritimibacter dapengensis TaxID=2836868 RepID=A0ABS6SX83_9RHOB|nr:long-chain-fatty-acid--CoA ligase [Maritimibacter dapengensis]MBV7377569.1 long-chain-fatty-acid--CoA ligase [Maritimibacter dapengensis]
MLGLMQDRQLLVSGLLTHAEQYHPDVEIVSKTCEGDIVRSSYRVLSARVRQLSRALERMGVKPGDRVATLAWNTHRHMELYFAVSGIGAVLHTVNPRLFPEQIDYIVNHGGAKVLCFDITFGDLVASQRDRFDAVETLIALTDADHLGDMPEGTLAYEDVIRDEDAGAFDWPEFDEKTASALCYTSGTTGNPKGVLYSHRSTVLHSFLVCQADGLKLSNRDSTLLAVPLFHVNAWGIPYASAMCGAKLVLPGPQLDGKSLFELAKVERCTLSLGVPTVWLGFFQHLDADSSANAGDLCLERVVIGGSAPPRALIERFRKIGVEANQAWGMSETGPVATVCNLLARQETLPEKEQVDVLTLQGRGMYGVELRVVDDDGNVLDRDGVKSGDLQVRGPWVTSGYFRGEGGAVLDEDGWFSTGDVATINPDGFVRLTDRSKDVIKSGGEWISSIDLENAAMSHPSVQEAAVIARPHPKWQERPLLVVVRKTGADVSHEELIAHLEGLVAKWWLPDDTVFVDELPHTATGKLQKMKLREQFADYELPA